MVYGKTFKAENFCGCKDINLLFTGKLACMDFSLP